jgi:hypothetical protein
MKRACACLVAIAFTAARSFAAESIFADLEDVYLTVLTDSVSVANAPEGVYAVAIGRSERSQNRDDNPYIPLPEAMWAKLAARLKAKGVDVSKFVPLADIGWKENQRRLTHRPSGKEAWVYSISSVTWHGGTQLRVSQDAFHGGLAAYGCTLILEKKGSRWVIVERTGSWIS